ncbi:MAG: molybdopterin synthase catalytic subunit MoaE [Micropepsaceae bacterium]
MIKISIQREDFDIGREIALLRSEHKSVGAIVSFTGLVRDSSHGEPLITMTLEHYPGMTEREIMRIAENAHQRWNLDGLTVVHRIGELHPSEQIVLVLAASKHRNEAFEAAQFLMDYLKVRAPFWKMEKRATGEHWVDARSSDSDAAARWER